MQSSQSALPERQTKGGTGERRREAVLRRGFSGRIRQNIGVQTLHNIVSFNRDESVVNIWYEGGPRHQSIQSCSKRMGTLLCGLIAGA